MAEIKKYTILFLFILSFFVGCPISYAQYDTIQKEKKWYIPSYLNMQYAGNMGFLSTCAGYYIYKDKLYLDIGYGYTSSSKAGRDIHNIILRTGYKPFNVYFQIGRKDFVFKPFFANITFTKQIKSDYTWSELPNYYPQNYYHQNAVRIHLDLGLSVQHRFKKFKLEMYYLVTTNDVYITYFNYYYHNHWIHWDKIFTQGLGVNIISLYSKK